MSSFRDATHGVWCLSWHPATDDCRFEPLLAVLRNNLVAFDGQHKAVLMVVGHDDNDVLTLADPQGHEHHGVPACDAVATYCALQAWGWSPAYFPVSIESAERWAWLLEG